MTTELIDNFFQHKMSEFHLCTYRFDVQLDFNFFRYTSFANEMGVRGSAHAEDLPFVFKTSMIPEEHYTNLQSNSEEIKLMQLLRTLIVKFAKFG